MAISSSLSRRDRFSRKSEFCAAKFFSFVEKRPQDNLDSDKSFSGFQLTTRQNRTAAVIKQSVAQALTTGQFKTASVLKGLYVIASFLGSFSAIIQNQPFKNTAVMIAAVVAREERFILIYVYLGQTKSRDQKGMQLWSQKYCSFFIFVRI